MSTYRRSEIVSGLFVTAAALVFALFAFKVGRFDLMGLLRPESVQCRVYFLDIKTLQVGSKVRVGGREVGEVTSLSMVERPWPPAERRPRRPVLRIPDPAEPVFHRLVNEVRIELTYSGLRLDLETAHATIAQDSLLSPHFLQLDPGKWLPAEPPLTIFEADLPDAAVIASTETAGLDRLMAIARPAVEELTVILRTLNRDLITPANMEALSGALAGLNRTLDEGYQIAATLNRGLLAPDNVEALDRMVHNLDRAVADGSAVAARLDTLLDPERDPRIDNIVTEVNEAVGELRENVAAVSEDLRRLLGDADRLLGETETELIEATRRLQRVLWQGEMALRKVRANPSVLFWGDDETDLEARDIDMTEIRLRGRARPYEQRDERDEP